ncbi:hypothetical protein TNCV_3700031 [Trichonephila clavipes]|nr:hypothetical protein TNCV_3700031 [Trichonephila clavipes]
MVASHRLRILRTSWCNISCGRSAHSSISICLSCWVSPHDVSVLQYISPKHPTHVRWDLNLGVRLPIHSSDIFTFQQLLNSKSPMWPCIVIHKNELWANGTSDQTHIGKKYLLTIAIPDYRPSIENVELSSPVQHNASSDKNSRTTVMVSFLDVTGIKPCPNISTN